MQIRLKNIGIIEDSTIALDGLTVITGKNNSGKTTVGKALYSVVDAVCNLQLKAEYDRSKYVRNSLRKVADTLEIFRAIDFFENDNDNKISSEYPALNKLFTEYSKSFFRDTTDKLEDYAHALADELARLNISTIEVNEKKRRLIQHYELYSLRRGLTEQKDVLLKDSKITALDLLKQLFKDLDNDADLVAYARESINQTLQVEFSNQIQPVKNAHITSSVEMWHENRMFFKFKISDNNIINDGKPVFLGLPFNDIYMIDNPYIVDELHTRPVRFWGWHADNIDGESVLDFDRIQSHNVKLRKQLRNINGENSIFEQVLSNEALKSVKSAIDKVLPGTFELMSDENYYVSSGNKLKLGNLATGSKLFAIIKMLLNKGKLTKDTLLILDEPEAHLHPEWQNKFAEVMVLLVKELGMHVVLTTHSPNFVLAVDAYMRKYGINSVVNFYQTQQSKTEGMVKYKCVNDDIGVIYEDFVKYLSEVKVLRDKLIERQFLS